MAYINALANKYAERIEESHYHLSKGGQPHFARKSINLVILCSINDTLCSLKLCLLM